MEGKNYYQISITLTGYTYADSPTEALMVANAIAGHWEDHCLELTAFLMPTPEEEDEKTQ